MLTCISSFSQKTHMSFNPSFVVFVGWGFFEIEEKTIRQSYSDLAEEIFR